MPPEQRNGATVCNIVSVDNHCGRRNGRNAPARPYKAMLWVLAIISLPVIGLLLYLLTGLRRQCGAPATHRRNGSAVQTIIRSCCGEPVTAYNRLTQLHNADKAYSALISEIQRARRSIHLEYYIFNDDRLGRTLINLLCRKSRAGVEVRIIYDAVGSWRLGRRSISRMRRAGIGIRCFRPLRFPWFRSGVARRNHRKIAVIDGTTAFVGGINIAKRYIDGNRLGKWRDEHLQLEGDIVGRLQRLFAADWQKVGGEAGDVLRHMPGHRIRSRLPVQIAWNDDGSACATLHDAFTAAIMRANRMEIPLELGVNIGPVRLFTGVAFRVAHNEKSNAPSLLKVEFNGSNTGIMGGVGLNIRRLFIDARITGYPRSSGKNTFIIDGDRRKVSVGRNLRWSLSVGVMF